MYGYNDLYQEIINDEFGNVDTTEMYFKNTPEWEDLETEFHYTFMIQPLPLRVYDKFNPMLKGIIKYIESKGMNISVSLNSNSAMFVSSSVGLKEIVITPEDIPDQQLLVIKLLHELGHFVDYRQNYEFSYDEFRDMKETDKGMVETEIVAWVYGEMLMRIFNKLFPEYAIDTLLWNDTKYDALMSYVSDCEMLDKLLDKENSLFKNYVSKKKEELV